MSIRGGVSVAIERACSIQCTAMQIFVKNNMQWFARPLRRDEISAFLDHVQRGELLSIFAHANYIISCVRKPERLCVCLDTAHVFAAGYDISSDSSVRKTLREFDRVIGRNRLVAIHLNDSKTACGSRVDRHEHIGKGRIGLDAFGFIMRDRRLSKIPKVLETPKGKDFAEDVLNLNTLRRLADVRQL